jgi:hypothetical protein
VGGWDLFFIKILAKVLTEYVFAGNLLILVNQGRVQGPLYQSKFLRIVSSAESPGIDKSGNGSGWMGGWVTFLPPLGLTKPGHRMPPCEESPGSGQ